MAGFDIDQVQAEFVAEIKLRNLNKEYILKQTRAIEDLKKEMADLDDILHHESRVLKIITADLRRVAKKYGKDRKTDIIYEDEIKQVQEEDFIEDYPVTLFLTKENYLKKITQVSLQASMRVSAEHKLRENDEIIQTVETSNKTELLMFSDKQNVYKIKCHDIPECKTSNIGEYLNNILTMDADEKIIYVTVSNEYKGYMLFAFENGKVAKVNMSAYETKTMRKKLINAYSSKFPLTGMMYIENDTDIVLVRDSDKAMLLNTAFIPEKQTKTTAGINVYTLKKNSRLARIMRKEDFVSEDIEYYRSGKIPGTGHFINDSDKTANNFPKQLDLF